MSTLTVKRSLVSYLDPFSPISNTYRTLRNMIELAPGDRERKVLVVSSAEPMEGKTTTAVNLAISYGQSNRKVLLIDGNAYRPSLHQIFSVSNDTGLSNVLFHSSDLEDTVKDVGIRNLSVLTSGPFLSVSSNPLDSDLLASLLARARDQYDIVIIDSPALLSLTDTSVLAVQSDGVLLVIHSEITRRDKAVKAKKLLEQLNVPLIGCVLNHAKSGAKQDYYQYSATRAK